MEDDHFFAEIEGKPDYREVLKYINRIKSQRGIQPLSPINVSRGELCNSGAVNGSSNAREENKDGPDGRPADQQMPGVSHIQRGICAHSGVRCGKRVPPDAG